MRDSNASAVLFEILSHSPIYILGLSAVLITIDVLRILPLSVMVFPLQLFTVSKNIHKLLSHDNTRTRIYVHFVILVL